MAVEIGKHTVLDKHDYRNMLRQKEPFELTYDLIHAQERVRKGKIQFLTGGAILAVGVAATLFFDLNTELSTAITAGFAGATELRAKQNFFRGRLQRNLIREVMHENREHSQVAPHTSEI